MLTALELLELLVEVTLELENDLLEELDLCAFAAVTVELIGLIEVLEYGSVGVLKHLLDFLDVALGLNDAPVDLLHALDVTLLALLGESGKTGLLIGVSFACLGAKFALGNGQDGLELAVAILVDVLDVVCVSLLLSLASSGLLKDASSFSDGVIIHEGRLSRDTIRDVVLETAIVGLVDDLSELLLHALQLVAKLDLPLQLQVPKDAFLLWSLLSNGVVVDKLVASNRLASPLRLQHLIPCARDAALTEQLHGQACHLALFADVGTQIITLLL